MSDTPKLELYDPADPEHPDSQRSFILDVAANLTADGIVAGLTLGGMYLTGKGSAPDAADSSGADGDPDDGGFLDG